MGTRPDAGPLFDVRRAWPLSLAKSHGLPGHPQSIDESLRKRGAVARRQERADLQPFAMAGQRDCPLSPEGFVELHFHPIRVQPHMSGLPASWIIVDAQLRPAELQFFAALRSSGAAEKSPGERENIRTHERRHGPGATKDEDERYPNVHCCNETEKRETGDRRKGWVWSQHRFEVNRLVALGHDRTVTAPRSGRNNFHNAEHR